MSSVLFVLLALWQLPAAQAQSLRGTVPAAVDVEGDSVFDPTNQSWAVRNVISCRYGVLCHGTEVWLEGVPKCDGTLVCQTTGEDASLQSSSTASADMQDTANTTAVANLLVCRYGSYCRGGWWYHYGRRECRGGIVCRHGPYYAGSEASEPTLHLGTSDSQDTALVALSPVEPTYDALNQSHGFSNLISCRFGVVCRGTWLWINGVRKCSGALVCKSGYKADTDVGSEVDTSGSASNFTTMMQDDSTTAVANLLVCRYGSYCRGGWWYHYGRRECRGGIVCRHGPYYAGSEASEPTLNLGASDSQDTALVALSPVEPTYDALNQSHGFSNLISCRFGVVCRGTWLWINGVRKCSGALVCKSGYKADTDVGSEVDTSGSASNFTTMMQDDSTTAVANLLVCRYGSYCRGGWWYHYGRRECRGGIVCRHGPYYAGSEASEPTLHLGTSDSQDTALVALSPVEPTYDALNQSHGFSNLISCRFGVVCRGTWLWINGVRKCSGALVCKSGYKADTDVGSEVDTSGSASNFTTMMQDDTNSTTAVANLLVCRYGSYCRGGWWYHYGRRECRGGIVCRHGPYYAGSEASEPTLNLGASDSQDTALVALSPVEPTYDALNQSHGFSNLISCRFGVVCRGTWLWINGVRKCSGALVCKSGYKADTDVGSEVDTSGSASNFTTMMQDDTNSTTAVANLLVCRYGSYCRGGWWYHYGRRECRGGIVCRHGPYYAGSEASEPTLNLGASDSQDTALVALSPVEPTYDALNQSHGFSNLISCRFGVVCRGTWLWINGVRKCSGALVCKSGYKADTDVGSEVDPSGSASNFTTMMQDDTNSTTAVANLLVCRYGSYCRGGWWYHYGRRECRGGIVCRHGPYYAGSEASEPTLNLGASDSQDTALVALSPVEPTYDAVNQSHGFSNLISCRFGVVCRGTWLWINGVRKCSGALVCKSGYKADTDVGSEVDPSGSASNFTTMMQDDTNSTTAVANLLVCRYGSYCRGGWWYHYGRRECRGGIVCRHGPYYAGSEASEPTLNLGASDSQDTALVALSPVEPTYDALNQSHGFSNLISCRFGVVCRGTWLWINGVRKCSGALVCKSGYKADRDVGSEVDTSGSASNFTTMMQDDTNSTTAVANLLVCRYGSYCRGGWWYHYGRRECRGGIVCRHGPY